METSTNPSLDQYRAKETIFTPSNLISIMRAMFVLPAIFCLDASQHDTHLYYLVAAIFVAAALTDVLDGIIARKTNTVSEFGKIVDPLADKIFVGLVVITMAIYHLIPLWFFVAIIIRDVVILAAGLWAKRKFRVVLPSNVAGKIAMIAIAITLFLMVVWDGIPDHPAGFFHLTIVLQWISAGLMLVSLWSYGQRLVRLVLTTKQSNTATLSS